MARVETVAVAVEDKLAAVSKLVLVPAVGDMPVVASMLVAGLLVELEVAAAVVNRPAVGGMPVAPVPAAAEARRPAVAVGVAAAGSRWH
ncbi:hypothetical protein WICPIJ_004105 [Wickerhamomyces pijperi]|uniref:Uncharacterized protein n=1 Tax=Wickerhamomyces pijperi TaxID=599730 RepID=A0A9P8Q676_WICPI|nr:hypothetical protein WICPIJ_004105 [Wickerhamomyces pijperi]